MILAESFWRSEKCRQNEFTISPEDSPLIAQFASNNTEDLVRSAEMVAPYVDGVDINCGCPQEWAIKKGMGCGLLRSPHKMEDFVKTLKRNLPADVSISTKIRVLDSPERTVELARRMEKCGVDFISIHGRTIKQKSSGPVDWDQIRLVKESFNVPVVGNGGITTLDEANECQERGKCDGIMVANALLLNPTFFSGSPVTTRDCIEHWMKTAKGIKWQLFQHHLSFMTEQLIDNKTRVRLNDHKRNEDIFSVINEEFDLNLDFHKEYDLLRRLSCPSLYTTKGSVAQGDEEEYFAPGKFFTERYKEEPEPRVKTQVDLEAFDDINCLFPEDE